MTFRIIIKLRREQITIPYQDSAHLALTGLAAAAWQQLVAAFPDAALSLNRILTDQSPEQLENLLDLARSRSGQEPPDLFSLMAIDVEGLIDVQTLVTAVSALPFVEFAYEESPHTLAMVDPSDDPLAPSQRYLGPAPFGIEALFAWSLPGADGANVRFADIEYGWQLNHEDLLGAAIVELNQSVPGHEFHSTACLGIVLAQDNNLGIIGAAPSVQGAIISALSSSLPDAFLKAVGFLQAGDILLIEQQTGDLKPIEMDPHIAMLIQTLTLLGIVVIEPAGNGGHDLDLLLRPDGTSLDKATFNFFDSRAIMVGARQALTRNRISFSCFGSRVDCHAWGEFIVTTSAPPSLYIGLNPLAGNAGFGGTSGASAIIAGAAAILQGIAKARETLLAPDRMRALLSDPTFNTLSNNPANDWIGVMPNLQEAVLRI
ncbi:S8 family serine peptidase [Desmonostoc muscorum LEGE 12446]|uniref:S8 family serine peptidase n=1 Tax=Desmonostoc muscorum LEGE 12446 TaxID=1828758 RepID=A0A8J6ZPR5_DESMC|nr:S8 family serine peptidase [Desmonostoc muscorum]MCF2151905.1 S8 family serine peptidase [Desmonostoc muscorum LEGE 12446]